MSSPARPQSSGVIVPARAKWHGRLAAWLLWKFANALAATLRWKFDDRSGLFPPGAQQRVIFAIWHNRLALAMILYRNLIAGRFPERQAAGLVSASRDGGLLARVLELFQFRPVRGSSSRRGSQALRELIRAAEEGCDLSITPDGPRGPRYTVQAGVIATAQLTGLPIVPVTFWLGWKKTLRSWDRFQIPLPFSRLEVSFGEPVWVSPAADGEERERLRAELERRLRALTRD